MNTNVTTNPIMYRDLVKGIRSSVSDLCRAFKEFVPESAIETGINFSKSPTQQLFNDVFAEMVEGVDRYKLIAIGFQDPVKDVAALKSAATGAGQTLFTFHLPRYDHDEIVIPAKSLPEAREWLDGLISQGIGNTTLFRTRQKIDDGSAMYHTEDAFDCPAFDEDGEQIDVG